MTAKGPHLTSEKLTIKEAAAALGVHPATIRRKIKDNTIKWEKDDGTRGQYYIPASEIDTYWATRSVVKRAREIDVTEITNEISEQRNAVIKLFERVSEMRMIEIATAENVRDMRASLEKLTAKIDELDLKLTPLDEGATSEGTPFSESEARYTNLKEWIASAKAKSREYWWQFWRYEKS